MKRRVVITGMGMVTPLGCGVAYNWARLLNGESGIAPITHFDASEITSRIAGVVPRGTGVGQLNADLVVPPKDQKKMDDFILYALAAAQEAVADSGWVPQTEEEKCRTGVMVGSGIGGLTTIADTSLSLADKGPRRVSPFFIPGALINLASGQISIQYGYKGPNHSVVTACATGTHAIGDSARLIEYGDADVMVAGGTESAVNYIGVSGFAALRALSTGFNDRPVEASRPFDTARDGFVISEGAGVVVLEEYEHARKRGARIYGEVGGYGLSGDAYHITSPAENGDGGYRAMVSALRHAGCNPEDIDYINAHGTSTPMGDGIEAGAVKRLFEKHLGHFTMSSTKSSVGHLLGAAGAIEAIYSLMALTTGKVPPTINLHDASPECAGLDLIPLVARDQRVRTVLSNSFGFGGTNASIVLKAV